jgi:hypothetical protein
VQLLLVLVQDGAAAAPSPQVGDRVRVRALRVARPDHRERPRINVVSDWPQPSSRRGSRRGEAQNVPRGAAAERNSLVKMSSEL